MALYLRTKILKKLQHIQTKTEKGKDKTMLKICLNEATSFNSKLVLHSNVSLQSELECYVLKASLQRSQTTNFTLQAVINRAKFPLVIHYLSLCFTEFKEKHFSQCKQLTSLFFCSKKDIIRKAWNQEAIRVILSV